MEKIKFGIAGCGSIGARHASHIYNNKRAMLVAVCDSKKEMAEKIASQYSAKAFNDFKKAS